MKSVTTTSLPANQAPVHHHQPATPQQGSAAPVLQGLFLKNEQRYERVPVHDIVLLQAYQNYTLIYTRANQYLYSRLLKQVEQRLSAYPFMRVHRSYAVNTTAITGFEGNMLLVGHHQVPTSKQYRQRIFAMFDVL